MTKGNIPLNKSLAKEIQAGNLIQELPEVMYDGNMYPLFTIISPKQCSVCGSDLKPHKPYDRFIISSYGLIVCSTTYSICSNEGCKKHHKDVIIGVTGSANYSDEFIEKQMHVRYGSHCSLHNTQYAGEIYGIYNRAPSPTTLWKYEQVQGKIAVEKLVDENINFNGKLYIDGYWVKTGWKSFIENQMGRELSMREWKKIRYKVIYVVATEDQVILDFKITNRMSDHLELIPLMNRIKQRIPDVKRLCIVSDEDKAIIGAVKEVFPNAIHSFCVFHQMKAISKKYMNEYSSMENVPDEDLMVYDLAIQVVLSETVIHLVANYHKMIEASKAKTISKASMKVVMYVSNIYFKNRKTLEAGFIPETNNVMEQLFSYIDSFIYQARSFKTINGLANFFNNLFTFMNHRKFNTGIRKGQFPLEIARMKYS